MSSADTDIKLKRRPAISWPIMIGVIAFFGLSAIFAYMLVLPDRVASTVPSALIGREAPETPLPLVPNLVTDAGEQIPGFERAMLNDRISVVNIWGSWCAPCRLEHPYLMELAEDPRVQMIGFNYKDRPDNAIRFLRQLGNPYDVVGADDNGRTAIEWGVYGVPETFIVGPDGTIEYKHVGPVNGDILNRLIMPEIDRIAAAQQ